MIRFDTAPSIIIQDYGYKGFFGFAGKGAIGKTFLYKLLDRVRSGGDRSILTITYDDRLSEEDVIKRVKAFGGGIIILDRLDLYISKSLISSLYDRRSNCLILYDLKCWGKAPYLTEDGIANIYLHSDSIEVDLFESSF